MYFLNIACINCIYKGVVHNETILMIIMNAQKYTEEPPSKGYIGNRKKNCLYIAFGTNQVSLISMMVVIPLDNSLPMRVSIEIPINLQIMLLLPQVQF